MSGRKLSFIIALALFSAPIAAGCAQDPVPDPGITKTKEQPQKTDEPKKTEPQADESGLIPTDDPNVFKATKILPRPAEAANYPKPEYPQLGYESSFFGAEAVALYLEDLVTYSYSTGDFKDLEAICKDSSNWCKTNINGAKTIASSDSWYLFSAQPKVTKTGVGVPPKEKNIGSFSVRVEVYIADHTHFISSEMLLKKIKAKRLLRHINLSYENDRWVIVSVNSEVLK